MSEAVVASEKMCVREIGTSQHDSGVCTLQLQSASKVCEYPISKHLLVWALRCGGGSGGFSRNSRTGVSEIVGFGRTQMDAAGNGCSLQQDVLHA